jgi:uncharacterized membrane protein YdbT with pleckstrin-like domain
VLPGPRMRGTVRGMAFPKRLLVPGEELVLDLRPHPVALVFPTLATIVILAAGLVGMSKTDGAPTLVILAAMVVLIVIYPLREVVRWLTAHFVVTSDRVIHRSGFIAKHSVEIPLEAINDIRFNQGVFERMVGAGDLLIRSASNDGPEVFEDIRHPEEVQKTIYQQGELNNTRMYQGGGQKTAPTATTELERLADLRNKGVLTEAEFQAQKAKILGNG